MIKILLSFLIIFNANAITFINSKWSPNWQLKIIPIANCVIKNEKFLKEISEIERFDYSKAKGSDVVNALKKDITIKNTTYKSWNWRSNVNAYTKGSNPVVNWNVRNNPRSLPEMINTEIHEGLHILQFFHGNNYSTGKENTVNYKVGKIAEKYVGECL